YFIFFFFSSRRRHTRSLRDWSSDVCSSDLGRAVGPLEVVDPDAEDDDLRVGRHLLLGGFEDRGRVSQDAFRRVIRHRRPCVVPRSEERRVGKEWRSRWWPYHYRKK